MDLLIDVNIALDICAKRQPFYTAARDALQLCQYYDTPQVSDHELRYKVASKIRGNQNDIYP